MRLPQTLELTTQAARFLFDHDAVEYHCEDPRCFYSNMYRMRLDLILDSVAGRISRGRLLDLGCAQGNVALLAAERGLESWAVDLRPEFLEYAGLKHERGKLFRVASNAASLPFASGFFHVVVWGEMIEHVAFPEQILAEIARVLARGGCLVLTTPNGSRLRTGLPTFSQVGDRAALTNRQYKPDSDGHLFLFRRAELTKLFCENGFRVERHRFYASPWISGRLGFRHFISWMPPVVRNALDRWTVQLPGVAPRLAEGQLMVARRSSP